MGGRDWMGGILGFLPQRFLADTRWAIVELCILFKTCYFEIL